MPIEVDSEGVQVAQVADKSNEISTTEQVQE